MPSNTETPEARAREVLAQSYEAARSWPSVPRDIRAGVDRDVSTEVAIRAMLALRTEALEEAARYHDAKAARWRKEAARHTRKDGRRSDYEQADLYRARRHEQDATAIRALSTSTPGE